MGLHRLVVKDERSGPGELKYQEVLEANKIQMKKVEEKISKECFKRNKMLLDLKLNRDDIIKALNT